MFYIPTTYFSFVSSSPQLPSTNALHSACPAYPDKSKEH